MGFTFATRPCLDPADLLRECLDRSLPTDAWFGKANVYRTSNGRGPGRGHLLLTRSDLAAIDQTKSWDLEIDDGDNPKVTLKKIVLLSAVCVAPGADADPDAAYLCEVADRRHFLARIPIDTAYNVKNAAGNAYLTSTLNSGVAWTWQQIVTNLTTALGLSTLTLPFTPHGTPENLTYYGGWAWEALNDVLDRLACGLDYDGTTDTFAAVRLGTTDTAAAAAVTSLTNTGTRVWDGRPVDPVRAWRPEKIRVRFPRRPLPTGGTSPVYTVDITLTGSASGVESGTYVQLDDDLTALAATGTPSNSSTLGSRAQERADDWLRKRTGYERPAQIVYGGHPKSVGTTIVGATYGRAAWEDRGPGMKAEIGAAPEPWLTSWMPAKGLPPALTVSPPAAPPGPPGPPGTVPFLARVTGNSGTPAAHTGERQTTSGGTLSDSGTSLTAIYLSDGSVAPTNGYLALTLMASGEYVGVPAQPASLTQPGWLTTGQQNINGDKDVNGQVTATFAKFGAVTAGYTPDATFCVLLGTTLVKDQLEIRHSISGNQKTHFHYSTIQMYDDNGDISIQLDNTISGTAQGIFSVRYGGTLFQGGNRNTAGTPGGGMRMIGGIYIDDH